MIKKRSYLVGMSVLLVSILMLSMSDKAKADYYKIQWGDTLSQLALDFEISTNHLVDLNNIDNPHLIYAGKTLYIPSLEEKAEYLLNIDQQDLNSTDVDVAAENINSEEAVEKEVNKTKNTIALKNVVELNPFKKYEYD